MCLKHCLVNMFVAQKAFATSGFTNNAGYSFGPFSHYMVNHPLKDGAKDYGREANDMDLNRWSERHVYYTLTGVANNMQSIRQLAKRWLEQGKACTNPESIAVL